MTRSRRLPRRQMSPAGCGLDYERFRVDALVELRVAIADSAAGEARRAAISSHRDGVAAASTPTRVTDRRAPDPRRTRGTSARQVDRRHATSSAPATRRSTSEGRADWSRTLTRASFALRAHERASRASWRAIRAIQLEKCSGRMGTAETSRSARGDPARLDFASDRVTRSVSRASGRSGSSGAASCVSPRALEMPGSIMPTTIVMARARRAARTSRA